MSRSNTSGQARSADRPLFVSLFVVVSTFTDTCPKGMALCTFKGWLLDKFGQYWTLIFGYLWLKSVEVQLFQFSCLNNTIRFWYALFPSVSYLLCTSPQVLPSRQDKPALFRDVRSPFAFCGFRSANTEDVRVCCTRPMSRAPGDACSCDYGLCLGRWVHGSAMLGRSSSLQERLSAWGTRTMHSPGGWSPAQWSSGSTAVLVLTLLTQ